MQFDAFQQYQLLRARGVPATEAIKAAFPQGLPNAQEQLKQQAGDAQKGQMAQLGGLLMGALGTRYAYHGLGNLFSGAGAAATPGATSLAGAGSLSSTAGLGGATTGASGITAGGAGTATTPFMGVGALPALGIAGMAALGANNLYEGGGKDILKGRGQTGDYVNSFLNLNPMTASVNWIGRQLGVGQLGDVFGSKGTKEYQGERLQEVKDAGDKGWAQFLEQARGQADTNNDTWKDGKFAGQQWSYDKALELAKEDPTHFLGVMGNAQTFGDDWHNIGIDKQKEITKQLIDGGYYHSDKGDVLIDKAKQEQARQLYANVINGSQPSQVGTQLANALQFNKPTTYTNRLPGFENLSDDEYSRIALHFK